MQYAITSSLRRTVGLILTLLIAAVPQISQRTVRAQTVPPGNEFVVNSTENKVDTDLVDDIILSRCWLATTMARCKDRTRLARWRSGRSRYSYRSLCDRKQVASTLLYLTEDRGPETRERQILLMLQAWVFGLRSKLAIHV